MDVNKRKETDISEEDLNFAITEEFPPVYSQWSSETWKTIKSEIQEEIWHFWLSMHGSTLGFRHLGFGFFIFTPCVSERWIGELPFDSWLLSSSLSRSRCGAAISSRLRVSGRPSASLTLWYWGRERTCRGASPSDGHSEDSESQWGTFPWPEAIDRGNRRGNRSQQGECMKRAGSGAKHLTLLCFRKQTS